MDPFSYLNPSFPQDLFSKGKRGGFRPHRPKPVQSEEEPAEELPPPAPEAKDKSEVVLSKLAWSKSKGIFNHPMTLSLEGTLPDAIRHVTKLEIKVMALLPDGGKEVLTRTEAHLKGGKASKEVTLFYPQYRGKDDRLLDECPIVFTAKHRNSVEVQSGTLAVRKFATKVRFEKPEGWIGAPVKVLADTDLEDGQEVHLRISIGDKTAVQVKAKAAGGKLEHVWTPCLCGIKEGKEEKLPESVSAQAELSYGKEKAVAAKPYTLKMVREADWETFSKDFSWNGFDVHSEYRLKLEGQSCKVNVKEKVVKAWGGYWVDMSRAGITGKAGGIPWDNYRWGRVDGKGMAPNQYYDGTQWKKMPAGFVPADGEYSALGFEKKGDKFVQVGGTAEWPEKFKDYDYDKYKDKRSRWIKDTHTRWSDKFKLRPASCSKGKDESGCGYGLDLTLELEKVETSGEHTIALCQGSWRSNAAVFFYGEGRIAMAAHEVGHLVGMPDEYAGGAIDTTQPDGDGLKGGIDDDSLMGANLTQVKKRHYATFSETAKRIWKGKTGAELEFSAARK
jgi:hypothetical protein